MSRTGTAAVFWALSDPLRLDLLDRIATDDAATVSSLAEALPITRQAVTRHLRTLEAADLVHRERHGREQRYRVNPQPLAEADRWLQRRSASWGDALDRLAAHVEGSEHER